MHPDQRYSLDAHTAQLKSYYLSATTNRLAEQPKCMEISIFPYVPQVFCVVGFPPSFLQDVYVATNEENALPASRTSGT